MVILHIAYISNNLFNGVCVAVPKHVMYQSEFAKIGLLNIKNIEIDGINQYDGSKLYNPIQFKYDREKLLSTLPSPFDKPDLVIFHECYRIEYMEIVRFLRKTKIPYIVFPHGELRKEAQSKKWIKKKIANFFIFNRFVRHAVAIQYLSENEREASIFPENAIIGSNGIEIKSRNKKKFSIKNIKFIYIGRYEWKVKGLDLMIDAVSKNKKLFRENNVTFHLYGPDYKNRYATVKKMIERKRVADIILLNHEISGDEKRNALEDADIFIQTSRHEGMPMGILEAMSYGLPCLITTGTNLTQLIAEYDAGWCAELSVDSIAEVMIKAVNEKDTLTEKGKNAIRIVESNYNWRDLSKQTVSQYNKLLERRALR